MAVYLRQQVPRACHPQTDCRPLPERYRVSHHRLALVLTSSVLASCGIRASPDDTTGTSEVSESASAEAAGTSADTSVGSSQETDTDTQSSTTDSSDSSSGTNGATDLPVNECFTNDECADVA